MESHYPDSHLHISDSSGLLVSEQVQPVFLNSTSPLDFEAVEDSISKTVFPFYGIHPWFADEESIRGGTKADALIEKISANHHCGIGECGLDFSSKYRKNRDTQIKTFEFQLEVAKENRLPLSIHCVKAWGSLLKSLRHFSPFPAPFLLHSFYGSAEVLADLLKLNTYISLSALSLRNPSKSEPVISNIPLDRILVESDLKSGSPDFSIENHFNILQNNYKTIAAIRSLPETSLISGVLENGKVFTN